MDAGLYTLQQVGKRAPPLGLPRTAQSLGSGQRSLVDGQRQQAACMRCAMLLFNPKGPPPASPPSTRTPFPIMRSAR